MILKKSLLTLVLLVLMAHMILSLTMQSMILNQLQTGHTETSLNLMIPSQQETGLVTWGSLQVTPRHPARSAGGWWVVNKANGAFKYVPATGLDLDAEVHKIERYSTDSKGEQDLKECFEPVPEKFRGKETGNKVLNDGCKFCSYRFDCWATLTERLP